ncbi:MAG: hypothetical protein AB7J28_15605 [Hyphomonadaceae bacterium]
MLAAGLIIVATIFAALFVLRFAGARRRSAMRHAPAIIAAMAAILFMFRGQLMPALILGIGAAALWFWSKRDEEAAPDPRARNHQQGRSHQPGGRGMSESQARAILGVPYGASERDIRDAYRRRMQRAHPDLGGSTEEAARLSAARDALLKR